MPGTFVLFFLSEELGRKMGENCDWHHPPPSMACFLFLFFGVLALNQHVSPLAHGEVHDNGYCRYSAPFTWKLLCLLRACKKMIG